MVDLGFSLYFFSMESKKSYEQEQPSLPSHWKGAGQVAE
jgi:hypothetical protein